MFDPYRTSHDSKNTYSLWADSKDIDMIKIICPKVRNNDEKIQIHNPLTPLQAELRRSGWQLRPSSPVEEAPDPPDSLLRRVVDRASLYDDPENFQKSYDMWKRMIRDGFLEALSPKAAYALKKLGFGRRYFQYSKPDPGNKVFFKTNVLLNILDFVQSNSEVELLFDRRLKVDERKEIHNLVQLKLKAKRLESADFDNTEQMELVLKIMEKNCYELQTASTGVYPNRQLCLTKVAPPHVYLIVPEDLKDVLQQKKGEVSSKLKKNLPQEVDKKAVGSPLEPKAKDQKPFKAEADLLAQGNEETNPFLISITKNLNTPEPGSEPQEIGAASYIESSSDKNDPKMGTPENFLEGTEISEKCLEDHELGLTEMDDDEILIPTLEEWLPFKDVIITPMSEVFDRLCDFLQEFRTAKTYTEFKFLGPFTDEELNAIDEFFEEAEKFLIKAGDKYMVPVFKKLAYEVGVDVTGNPVIYKKCVAQQRKLQCRCHPTTEHLGALKKATANRNN
ncbi:unnamed protein product [Chrysodeixis includens]|uniref:Uncharacterized protein n=1 Tax=Chrysodeixis includens TaxID=689277 RepID=A0A9P0C1S0_CHRIL|nr:unnamed protein product [Chrysodeixis includens]